MIFRVLFTSFSKSLFIHLPLSRTIGFVCMFACLHALARFLSPMCRDTLEVDVTLKAVSIPAKETTYWCHIQKLDEFIQQKHHIVQFEPLITNEDIVHHMEVFHCETDVDAEIPLYNGDCEQLPEAAKICNRVISLWAMGASAFTYPKEAGLPIGGENYNPFIRLEVHFNNPELKAGKKTH